MSHPFELELSDLQAIELDFEEELTNEEAAKVGGGITAREPKLGKQGGCIIPPHSKPKDPIYTTLAVGEEGGDVTTLAIGEEGGDW